MFTIKMAVRRSFGTFLILFLSFAFIIVTGKIGEIHLRDKAINKDNSSTVWLIDHNCNNSPGDFMHDMPTAVALDPNRDGNYVIDHNYATIKAAIDQEIAGKNSDLQVRGFCK